MSYFRVDGTSVVSWSLLIEATSESEASQIARRTAGSQGELRRAHALLGVSHRVDQALKLIQQGDGSNGRGSLRAPEPGRIEAERQSD